MEPILPLYFKNIKKEHDQFSIQSYFIFNQTTIIMKNFNVYIYKFFYIINTFHLNWFELHFYARFVGFANSDLIRVFSLTTVIIYIHVHIYICTKTDAEH